jgi:hypothetical protein
MSKAERIKLRIYAAWLIVAMYANILAHVLNSPDVLRRYVYATHPSLREDIERKIDANVLNERDRKLLKRRVLDGIKFEPLAEEFELSERQARNICDKYKHLI